ncbi:hypothetical protein MPSI1_000140 [Malassezia psittaci]|uniref:Uncharacterized protein n=1 Tax=Malassezia psittaci TaxID=1821823 RepID=A0AAF0F621_9BASI|nr:hypothetical protein MPSI1_000140 [Malassezia psittaci]
MSTYEASETNPITSPSAVEQSTQQQTQDNSILSNEAVPLSNTDSANIDVPASTTVYTTETPAVVESSDHHLVSESVPITHTRIPDYDERTKPAPAIGNYDLASILRSGATVSQDTAYLAPRESYGANLTRELERETAVPESTSDVPKAVYASEDTAQTSYADDSASKYNSTANEASASSRFDSVPEQPWSVRGPPPAADSSWKSSVAGATGAGASSTGGSGIDASNTRTSDVDASSTGVSGVGASNATTSGLTDSKTDAATTSVTGRGATGNVTSDYSAAKSSSDEPQSVSDWAKSTSTEPKNDLTSSTGARGSDATGVAGATGATGATGAAGTGSDVASGATGAGSSATSGVTGSGKNAVSGVTSGAKDSTTSGVSGVTGGAKDATSGVTGGAKDSVSGAAATGQNATSGVTGGAKNATSGATSGVTGGAKNAVSSGKQGATSAAEKPKKVGMIKKIKKALNMGSSAK